MNASTLAMLVAIVAFCAFGLAIAWAVIEIALRVMPR